jgi:hypothetical protein
MYEMLPAAELWQLSCSPAYKPDTSYVDVALCPGNNTDTVVKGAILEIAEGFLGLIVNMLQSEFQGPKWTFTDV